MDITFLADLGDLSPLGDLPLGVLGLALGEVFVAVFWVTGNSNFLGALEDDISGVFWAGVGSLGVVVVVVAAGGAGVVREGSCSGD